MLRVRLVRAARQDVLESIAWYREQAGRERATDFRAELTRVLEFAGRFPRGGAVVARVEGLALRQFLLQRYPYVVIGTPVSSEFIVFAVAHQSREPNFWRPRVPRQHR